MQSCLSEQEVRAAQLTMAIVRRVVESADEDRQPSTDDWTSAQAAVSVLVPGKLRAALVHVLSSARKPPCAVGDLACTLVSYGEILEYRGERALALDAYKNAVAVASTDDKQRGLADAYLRIGICEKYFGKYAAAAAALKQATVAAVNTGDEYVRLRICISIADIQFCQGRAKEAITLLNRTIVVANTHEWSDLAIKARHDRGVIWLRENEPEFAAADLLAALAGYGSRMMRERALSDVALALADFGELTVALEIFRALYERGLAYDTRCAAAINLFDLSDRLGHTQSVESWRRLIVESRLSAAHRAQFLWRVGESFERRGEPEEARVAYEGSLSLARESELQSVAEEVSRKLSGLGGPPHPTRVPSQETVAQLVTTARKYARSLVDVNEGEMPDVAVRCACCGAETSRPHRSTTATGDIAGQRT